MHINRVVVRIVRVRVIVVIVTNNSSNVSSNRRHLHYQTLFHPSYPLTSFHNNLQHNFMAKKSSRVDTPSSQLSDEALSAVSSSQPAKKGLGRSTVAFAQSQSKRQRIVDTDQCQPHEPNSTNLHSSPGDSAMDTGGNCRHHDPNIDASNTKNSEDNGNEEDKGKGGHGGEVKDYDQDMHEFVLTLPPLVSWNS